MAYTSFLEPDNGHGCTIFKKNNKSFFWLKDLEQNFSVKKYN